MKKLIIGILVFAALIFAYYKYWTSDNNERRLRNKMLACIDKKLAILQSSQVYQSAFTQANIFYQTQKDSLRPFTEIKVPVERIFDRYIFFSHDSSKCIMMLLEKYPTDFQSGYLRIIRGDLKGRWNFTVGMHMSFPVEDIPSLFPNAFRSGVRQYTFEMLSKRGRIAVINNGEDQRGCEFDEKWWFKND